MMDEGQAGAAGSVAARISHRIDPANEQAYEEILAGVHEAVLRFDGYLRREVIKSTSGPHLEYTTILHFNSAGSLHRWENSPERLAWTTRLTALAAHSTPLQVLTGLETWFTLATDRPIVPPPRYKMAAVTWFALFPLITLLAYAMAAAGIDTSIAAHSFIATVILVPLMTYVVMPRMTRLFARWLYPG